MKSRARPFKSCEVKVSATRFAFTHAMEYLCFLKMTLLKQRLENACVTLAVVFHPVPTEQEYAGIDSCQVLPLFLERFVSAVIRTFGMQTKLYLNGREIKSKVEGRQQ